MDKINLSYVTLGATFLALLLAVVGLHIHAAGRSQQRELIARMSQAGQWEGDYGGGRRPRFLGVDRRLRRTGLGKRIDRKIATTGLDLSVGEFAVYSLIGVFVLYFFVGSFFAPFFGVLAALAGLGGANGFLNWQRTKRTEAFINQLPELTRVLANATQAGLAMRTALSMAAEELDAPAGEELRRVSDRLAVGHSLDDALDELADRLPSRELMVLVSTLVLSNRAGGQVVTSLRNLTTTLEERKETRREVTTMLSQIKVTAVAVPALGLAFLLLINQATPGALDRMTGSGIGRTATVIAFALYGLGLFLIRRMSAVRV